MKRQMEEEEQEKIVHQKNRQNSDRIYIINDSSIDTVRIQLQGEDNGTISVTQLDLPYQVLVDCTEFKLWDISVQLTGLIFEETGTDRLLLDSPGIFRIMDDPLFKPLTHADFMMGYGYLLKCLQNRGRPPYGNDCWEWISEKMDRDILQAQRLKRAICDNLSRSSVHWSDLYYASRSQPLPFTDPLSRKKSILNAIEQEKYGVVLYFRDSDSGIFKSKLQVSNYSIVQSSYNVSDGSTYLSTPLIKQTDKATVHKHLIFPLKLLIDNWVSHTTSPNASKFGLDINGTIEVVHSPQEETKWGSVEVLLYVPSEEDRDIDPEVADFCEVFDREKKFLAFRFHQRKTREQDETFLPSEISLELIKGAKEIASLNDRLGTAEPFPFGDDVIDIAPNFLID